MPSRDFSTDTVCRNVSCLMFEEESINDQSKGVGLQKTEDDDDDDYLLNVSLFTCNNVKYSLNADSTSGDN